jgi:tetratricopeptide (TPR) repeat protein
LQVLAPVPSPSLVPSLSADAKSAVDDLSKRVEALDAWQAANSNAQDVLKDSRRLSSLEADISGLKTLAARNAQVLSSANDRLSHIESQRFAGTTVYGLMAVLVLSLVGLGVLWRRSVNVSGGAGAPWWSSVGQKSHAVAEGANAASSLTYEEVSHLGEDLTDQPHAAKSSSKHDADGESSLDIDLNLGESVFPIVEQGKSDSASSVLPTLTDAHLGGRREFANSGIGTLRAVNTKEMLDVRQQAEFFMTLGQHDEAVKILEASIQNSDESNPLVYLDLLKVLHTLSKKSEFERYREEFNRQFTGIVPAYASFIGAEGALEEYPDICRQLSELWPNEDAVDYIEFCLVRSADIPADQGLELEAFKDLLMLHGVIRRLESMVDSGMVPFSAPRSVASQLPESEGKTFSPSPISFQHSVVPPLPVIEESPVTEELDLPLDLNLDLDLSEKIEPKDNLIEFDLSGYPLSASGATVPPKG